ncbi:MAG: hypothetical protein AABW86_03650 [Candidatus Micrarchaeota archaeon]
MTLRQRFSDRRGTIIGSCVGIVAAGFMLASVPALKEEIRGLEGKYLVASGNVVLAKGDGNYRSCALLEYPVYRKGCVSATDTFITVNKSLSAAKINLSSAFGWSSAFALLGLAIGQLIDTIRSARKAKAALKLLDVVNEQVCAALENMRIVLESHAKKGDPQ